ncbi:hypothetical protein ABT337_28870 [Saccharopolyspora hirsuta]|uniref:hypothetical protein n=1 Tax=Saccharopolyspora hirsuta TaxID=1837 RepID=UPI00331BAE40
MVAKLVDLHNALLAARPSRVPGSDVQLSVIEAIRNTDAAAYRAAYESGAVDAQTVVDALRPVVRVLWHERSVARPAAHHRSHRLVRTRRTAHRVGRPGPRQAPRTSVDEIAPRTL